MAKASTEKTTKLEPSEIFAAVGLHMTKKEMRTRLLDFDWDIDIKNILDQLEHASAIEKEKKGRKKKKQRS